MNIKKLMPVLALLLVGCGNSSKQDKDVDEINDNSSSKDKQIIDDARANMMILNQRFNQLYNAVALQCLEGNREYEAATVCLQELTKEMIDVNKSLKIDCIKYDANGKPQMIQHEDGTTAPLEIIPKELKLTNKVDVENNFKKSRSFPGL